MSMYEAERKRVRVVTAHLGPERVLWDPHNPSFSPTLPRLHPMIISGIHNHTQTKCPI